MKVRIALLKNDKTWEDMLLEMGPGSPMGFEWSEIVYTFLDKHPEFFKSRGHFKEPYIEMVQIPKEKKCRKTNIKKKL